MIGNNKHLKLRSFLLYIFMPLILISLLFDITADIFTERAYAETDVLSAYEDGRRIYDDAGLLSDMETEELEALSKEYGEQAGIEIFVLTDNNESDIHGEEYIENFEDQLPVGDHVYFFYDVYYGEIYIQGYGLAETYIHSKRIDKIFDSVENDLRNGNYFEAFKSYIIQAAAYMKDDSELNYDHNYVYDNPPEGFDPDNEYSYDDFDYDKYDNGSKKGTSILFNVWFQLIISVSIGAVTVALLAYNSGGKMAAGAKDYLDKSRPGLIGCKDHYITSTITKTRRSTDTGSQTGSGHKGGFNAGGFRGGISSGGRSHSSGGRKL